MWAPLKYQLIVARIIGILFIYVACVDHKNHHFAVVCQFKARLESTLEHDKLEDLQLSAGAGFEFDVNGQEQEKITARAQNSEYEIRQNHWAIDHRASPIHDHSSSRTNTRDNRSKKTNPLIDLVHSSADDVSQDDNNADDDYDDDDSSKFNLKDESFSLENDNDRNQKNVHSTSKVDSDKQHHDYHHTNHPHQIQLSGDLARANSQWCSMVNELDRYCRELKNQNYSEELRVCGSDGRFHESICDFKRHSCRSTNDNHHLFQVKPRSYCEPKAEVACSRGEYRQFKLALLNEFNEDIELMFRYFDSNHNGLIEARELWPRARDENDELGTGICDNCYQQPDDEYAFAPHFDWSSCSLSHLLLYENKSSLTKKMFLEAFAGLKNRNHPSERSNTSASHPFVEKFKTKFMLNMGESIIIDCVPQNKQSVLNWDRNDLECLWTRYGVNLGTVRDDHITFDRTTISKSSPGSELLQLHLKDAQLYLSGPYECSCSFSHESQQHDQRRTIQHQVNVQILAQPRVSVRPKFQWSLPDSRIAFECHHDFIDTNFDSTNDGEEQPSSFEMNKLEVAQSSDYKLKWSRDNQHWIVDSKDYDHQQKGSSLAPCSEHASIVSASGRLVLERVQVNDTGRYYCHVEQFEADQTNLTNSNKAISNGQNFGSLLIQDERENLLGSVVGVGTDAIKYLWFFHENGLSVYKLRTDDGQELELVRELAGNSPVISEVDGNWNQLTLCGGLNPDQVVVCEWSDNALVVEVPRTVSTLADDKDPMVGFSNGNSNRVWPPDKYIYVGQPNLNRVIVMDGQAHEIVAIINTEPQPRKLYSFKPNKIHLSKWVRRRLSPLANARWLKAIDEQQNAKQQQSQAHPLKLTPKSSRLYSDKQQAKENDPRLRRHSQAIWPPERRQMTQPKLVQHDIWLLCYGQPLVVDPTSDLSELTADRADERAIMQADSHGPSSSSSSPPPSFYKGQNEELNSSDNDTGRTSLPPFTPLVATWPLIGPHWVPSITNRELSEASSMPSVSSASSTAQPYSTSKEARLRNRKSVQVIQSTFFPTIGIPTRHRHNKKQIDSHPSSASQTVGKFKRLAVLTTHYVIANRGLSSISDNERSYLSQNVGHELRGPQFDLVQSLLIPQVPYSQKENHKFKLHHAYVTHYDERQLYRISMDSYRYDKEIDLQDCDPVNLVSASQGLLIVQCRSPITHKLVGQLVLDELSSHTIQFNENIKAQESCLTPDNRYLISIHTNQSSTIYVQSVKVDGLSFLYEIKTSLETTQCSFVWRDGYYAAIFVALNRRDRQSELLSLRLADSRLELIVRVPGLMNSSMRHKEPLNVEPELQIVSLSTDSGVHIIDLEENRIIQTMDYHHQRITPTLLWV